MPAVPAQRCFAELPILDGGGLGSTADWLRPRVSKDVFHPLRKRFGSSVREAALVPRLRKHLERRCGDCLFSVQEVQQLRDELVQFLRVSGSPCTDAVAPHQPFLLDAWRACAELCGDVDAALPNILVEGVSTGILDAIPASGVCFPVCVEDTGGDLLVHAAPWSSAMEDPALTRRLLQQDIDAGYLMHLPGGAAEARDRWGDNVAAGKLGVACAPGKKPRLIGDGTVSGANRRAKICEKVRLPSLESLQRFAGRVPTSRSFTAFSSDIRGAHKLVRVRESEQGFPACILEDAWYRRISGVAGPLFGCQE